MAPKRQKEEHNLSFCRTLRWILFRTLYCAYCKIFTREEFKGSHQAVNSLNFVVKHFIHILNYAASHQPMRQYESG